MYCVGLFVTLLFNVTARLVVDAAPLLIAKDATAGRSVSVIVSLTPGDSPTAFLTLK